MNRFVLFSLVWLFATTLTAKSYRVIFVDGNVIFKVNNKTRVAVKDMQVSDNWVVQMEDHSTLIIMGKRKHEIGFTKNIKGKKLKNIIGKSDDYHILDYPKQIWDKLCSAISNSDPEVKNKKVVRFNGHSVRGNNDQTEQLDEYQLEFVRIIEEAIKYE